MKPISLANAEHYFWGDRCEGWHLLKRDHLSVIQERVPPGQAEIKHLHSRSRQFFYILSGTATLVVGETAMQLSPFQGFEVPPEVPHQFRNDSDTDVIFLVISSPQSHGDRQNLPALP